MSQARGFSSLGMAGEQLISIITPVFNGLRWLKRAVDSVRGQSFQQWELLCVDDGSTDGSPATIERWAADEPRIRLLRTPENRGPGAARNVALRAARGRFVCYLDQDDEYYPHYRAEIARLQDRAEVLVFNYDMILPGEDGQERVIRADPGSQRGELFAKNIANPIAVAHRRSLVDKFGGFEEIHWLVDDWTVWKRFGRGGTEFLFVPQTSGRYHVRPDSLSRVPRLSQRQRAMVEANRQAGKPIYGDRHPSMPARKVEKIAYLSPHCLVDFTNNQGTRTDIGILAKRPDYAHLHHQFVSPDSARFLGGQESSP